MSIRPKIKITGAPKKPSRADDPFDVIDGLLPPAQGNTPMDYGVSDVGAQGDMEALFATAAPAAMFDLELPWTAEQGQVLNKYGVPIAKFGNWEAAEAVVAMMNGATDLLQKISELPAPAPAQEPVDPTRVELTKQELTKQEITVLHMKGEVFTFQGVPSILNSSFAPDELIIGPGTMTGGHLDPANWAKIKSNP